jgi:hypothetical protein
LQPLLEFLRLHNYNGKVFRHFLNRRLFVYMFVLILLS